MLSSDYVPLSLIQAAFALPEIAEGVGLADAVKLVTKTPAEAVGLDDRGDFFDIPPGHDAYVDGPDRVELVLFEPPAHDH